MFALIDCNSFFCSVEKVFHPGLSGRPVCVLSNNDGCIVALTPEAKQLGLRRGDPIFKVRHIVSNGHVAVFSTNMPLYAAMSKRVTSILRKSLPVVETYSIDESFCDLEGIPLLEIECLMHDVVEKVRLYTDIPVSVGVAPTKTLAKVANKFAKGYKAYQGVCMINSEEKRRRALQLFPLEDVWGIGRQTFEKCKVLGLKTAWDFSEKSETWVKRYFTKPIQQIWLELNGVPCIDTTENLKNQTITTSRSFGEMVTDLPLLKASVATFSASCANKLRGQRSVARSVTVYLCSNRFRTDLEQYVASETFKFITPTSDTLEITQAALSLLQTMYRPGIYYKKTGVIVGDISDASFVPMSLFDPIKNRQEHRALMKVVDKMNQRFGLKTIRLSVEGERQQKWHVKCEHQSQAYLTDIDEILTIKI
ncbi:MAG: Y-family DNA polymerase [Bacteroidaceae bacterium]|nr:Y-family DNA polymerase [Bacteroidaceae bacterium]